MKRLELNAPKEDVKALHMEGIHFKHFENQPAAYKRSITLKALDTIGKYSK